MEENSEKLYEVSFQIILNTGDAQDAAMKAIAAAEEDRFEEAGELVKKAQEYLKAAHKSQTDIMAEEANGAAVNVNAIMMHAYDHYTMALMAVDMANMAITMHKRIAELVRMGD